LVLPFLQGILVLLFLSGRRVARTEKEGGDASSDIIPLPNREKQFRVNVPEVEKTFENSLSSFIRTQRNYQHWNEIFLTSCSSTSGDRQKLQKTWNPTIILGEHFWLHYFKIYFTPPGLSGNQIEDLLWFSTWEFYLQDFQTIERVLNIGIDRSTRSRSISIEWSSKWTVACANST